MFKMLSESRWAKKSVTGLGLKYPSDEGSMIRWSINRIEEEIPNLQTIMYRFAAF